MPILLKPTAATSQLSAIDHWITLDIMRGLSKTRAAMLIFFGCPLVLILGLNLLFQDDLISLNKMILHANNVFGVKCHPTILRIHCCDYVLQQMGKDASPDWICYIYIYLVVHYIYSMGFEMGKKNEDASPKYVQHAPHLAPPPVRTSTSSRFLVAREPYPMRSADD